MLKVFDLLSLCQFIALCSFSLGFVGLEVFKYIKGVDLSAYRGATVNLGTNVFCVEQLPDPRRKKTGFDPETYGTGLFCFLGWAFYVLGKFCFEC